MSKQNKPSGAKATTAKKLKITLIKSVSGRLRKHQETVKCLGLRRINQSAMIDANSTKMGMVKKVSYLLKVEEV